MWRHGKGWDARGDQSLPSGRRRGLQLLREDAALWVEVTVTGPDPSRRAAEVGWVRSRISRKRRSEVLRAQASRCARPFLDFLPVPHKCCRQGRHGLRKIRMTLPPLMHNLWPGDSESLGDFVCPHKVI